MISVDQRNLTASVMARRPNHRLLAMLHRTTMHTMTHERRILVLPDDWSSTEPVREPRPALSSDLAFEETARALTRELQQRAILAAITHRK
jgi:hypothetical protein